MKKATKKELKVFMTLTLILLVSIIYLMAMGTFTHSVCDYAACQSEIKFLEETGNKIGWTDELYNEVKEAEAKREEMAEADPIFGWLNDSRSHNLYCVTRNILVFALYVLALLAIITSAVSTVIIILRQLNYYKHFAKRIKLEIAKQNTCIWYMCVR